MAPESVGQNDVEEVKRVEEHRSPENIKDEVIITFKDKKIWDLAMISSVNLTDCVDGAGKPTASTRLKIRPELKDTFRLLSRFGTRLRARHGKRTKRNIMFDDYSRSLYANIKLPGETMFGLR